MNRALVPLLIALSVPATLGSTEVKIFRSSSQASLLEGTFDGVSVDPLGTLRLADRAERLTAVEEPFLLTAVKAPKGWLLGTGNAGRVLSVDPRGEVSVLFETAEPEVFAVWADPDGTVFAGSSPRGKVYRYRGGRAEVFFDPEQTYIWGLGREGGGALLVATGTEGKLFAVDDAGAGKVLYDSDDTHLRSLLVLDGGGALIGTAGEGLVLELRANGEIRTLYDAAQPEIVAFTRGHGGEHYVAALASEASFVDLARSKTRSTASESEKKEESDGESEVKVTVETGSSSTAGSRLASFSGPRSEILAISPRGAVSSVWKFDKETVYSLDWQRDRLWVGTGLEGKLYSYRNDRMVLEQDVDERQVVMLLGDAPGPAFATTNAAALYRVTGSVEREGLYTSTVLDAGQVARFGILHWNGAVPPGSRVEFGVRSGISSAPDRTWSPWTEGRQGREITLADVPRGRYLQWRAALVAEDGSSPFVRGVEISYLQENQRPEIESFEAMEAGQVLVPSNFNPSTQAFEPAHPNREGIFTTLAAATESKESSRYKTLWKLGYRTLKWEASDPNGDDLVYRLAFRREGEAGDDDDDWLSIGKDLEESHYSFDATVLPDGRYRFRLEASDRKGNLEGDAMVSERISETVVIDHGPPWIGAVRSSGRGVRVEVGDALSPLREAVFSVDAGDWKSAEVVDGLLDGREETLLLLAVPENATLVLLRLTDAAHNVVTFDLSDR